MQERYQELVEKLQLLPHPEGGYYKETYRSEGNIPHEVLSGSGFSGHRSFSTAIYFLLTHHNFSAFHRILQDELWHFYEGDPVDIHCIRPDGSYENIRLGPLTLSSCVPQAIIPAGYWFASAVRKGGSFALTGCTVAPGFDFADFELASQKELIEVFPQHSHLIKCFTRS
ncbi:cupin domain-containing protein [Ascidiimonas aurantiaca]|uniref:cupin domain-containing protein n=1 Tax=Ascidiimonas aurantiaca TaxID=1685432 RepID=UPI0030EBBE10